METLENELSQARTDFLTICINLNYNKSICEKAYKSYIKASDNLYKPKILELQRRLKTK